MEKLSLRKFEDFQINKQELKKLQGGMDICTGGGFENEWLKDGNSYVLASTLTWSSDVIDGRTGGKRLNDKVIKTYDY